MGSNATGVALFGATGYSGREAARLLQAHPYFRLAGVFGGRERDGVPLAAIHPSLRGSVDAVCAGVDGNGGMDAAVAGLAGRQVPYALLATPETISMALAPRLLRAGLRVIDLSGAFRLKSASDYPAWYGFEHQAPGLLEDATYGLTEWYAGRLGDAGLVANPGCYPTAALLAILPLARAGVIDGPASVVIHAVSGASGAGRQMREELLFCEVEGSIRPYGMPRHRHLAEIAQATGLRAGAELAFFPHIAPIDRGLLCSITLKLRAGAGPAAVANAFTAAYADAPFVRLLGEGVLPATGDVRGSNACAIGWCVDPATGRASLFSAIDNLIKGAAGQAIQNLNLMAGRPAAEGLPR